MSRLTEAGENISETLFNASVVNGLPEKYEHFIVQESFNPAANFTELRTRRQNFDDSRFQRNQAEEGSATAMYCNMPGRNKGPSKPKRRPVTKTVLCPDILVILPSNVAKEVQLIVQSAKKGTFTKSMSK